jgi:hypothetical protein
LEEIGGWMWMREMVKYGRFNEAAEKRIKM